MCVVAQLVPTALVDICEPTSMLSLFLLICNFSYNKAENYVNEYIINLGYTVQLET